MAHFAIVSSVFWKHGYTKSGQIYMKDVASRSVTENLCGIEIEIVQIEIYFLNFMNDSDKQAKLC